MLFPARNTRVLQSTVKRTRDFPPRKDGIHELPCLGYLETSLPLPQRPVRTDGGRSLARMVMSQQNVRSLKVIPNSLPMVRFAASVKEFKIPNRLLKENPLYRKI